MVEVFLASRWFLGYYFEPYLWSWKTQIVICDVKSSVRSVGGKNFLENGDVGYLSLNIVLFQRKDFLNLAA